MENINEGIEEMRPICEEIYNRMGADEKMNGVYEIIKTAKHGDVQDVIMRVSSYTFYVGWRLGYNQGRSHQEEEPVET